MRVSHCFFLVLSLSRLVHPSDMFTDNSLVKDDMPQNDKETLKYVFIDSSFHLNLII